MKIRNGFVSNSSTASFIIYFKSDLQREEIATYIYKSDEWIEEHWEEHEVERFDFNVSSKNKIFAKTEKVAGTPEKTRFKTENKLHSFEVNVTMFNDWMDIAVWKFVRALSESRFDDIKLDYILKTEEEYTDCNDRVEFDHISWEYDWMLHDHDRKKSDIKKARIVQKNIDLSYREYLIQMGVKLPTKEINELAKYQLNK